MRRSSIRVRITTIAVALVLLVLLTASLAVIALQRAALIAVVDDGLSDRLTDITRLARNGALPARITPVSSEEVVQVVAPDGRVVAATPHLSAVPPLALPTPAPGGSPQVGELRLGDDDVRFWTAAVPGVGIVHVGIGVGSVSAGTVALTRALAVTVPAATAVLGILVWWLVGRSLRPVEDIRRRVAAIGYADLGERVPRPGGGDEIDRLAGTMNDMLARLESAALRQRRFVADASHELRSPLTRMRTQFEVELATNPAADPAVAQALGEVIEMQHTVEDMLHLAAADSGQLRTELRPVDLDDIVFREARRAAEADGVRVDTAQVSGAHVRGDPAQLTRAVRNLTENARRHAASRVTLRLAEEAGAAVLVVSDDGPGIPAQEADAIFEPFAQRHPARPGGGAGLGLAIVRDVAHRHGGWVVLRDPGGPGASFELRLPLG